LPLDLFPGFLYQSHTHKTNSTPCSVPLPSRQRGDVPSYIGPPVLSRGGAIGLPAMLEYVVPFKTDNVLHSPGRIVDTLR
jgi:hypothetical protein